MTDDSLPPEPNTPPAIPCPWCPYTAPVMKAVLHHMEARHPQRWQDLALYPPIADGVYGF
jgi:hypothetical protein